MKKALILLLLLMPLWALCQAPPPTPSSLNLCTNTYTAHAPIAMNGVSNIVIRGDSINANNTSTIPIHLTNCTNVTIKRCKIMNSSQQGILLVGCVNVTIDSCYITNVSDGVHDNFANGKIVFTNNYVLNVNGPYPLGNAIQLNNVNSGGILIQNNYIENQVGVAKHPQDLISIYQSNGLPGDSIRVIGNYIKGGQYQNDSGGAAGIVLGDVGGSWQVARGNYIVNGGYVGAQVQGGHDIKMDHNFLYGSGTPYTVDGLSSGNYSGVASYNVEMSYNRINWRQSNFGPVFNKFWDSSNGNPQPAGWNTNTATSTADAGITASILPSAMIVTCSAPPLPSPPVISYLGSPYNFTVGTTIGALTPSNSGGTATSWSISPALPSNLVFNTSTGTLSGTPVTTSPTTVYTITASNSGGTGRTTIGIQVNPTPPLLPSFSYSPSSNVYTIPQTIAPLSPISTGGPVTSYSITPALPPNLVFSTTTGIISGSVSAVSPQTVYTVTGTNSSGSGQATVQIQVLPNPIIAPNISYSPNTLSATYGTAFTALTPTNTGSAATWSISPSLPAGMSFSSTTGVISGLSGVVSASNNYTVTATNSSGTSHATVTISVGKANLTITAINQQKYVNTPNPSLTFGIDASQLLNGDNVATALQTAPTLSTTAVTGSPIGNYPITASGASSNNYNLTYVPGTLQIISPATMIIYTIFGGIH